MADKHRSLLEARLAPVLYRLGAEYERETYPYTVERTYKPDFCFRQNGVCTELKGYFTPADRSKMLKVRDQNPGLEIRLVFQAPDNRLSKKSKTTYWQWAEKHGFQWCAANDLKTLRAWAAEVVSIEGLL